MAEPIAEVAQATDLAEGCGSPEKRQGARHGTELGLEGEIHIGYGCLLNPEGVGPCGEGLQKRIADVAREEVAVRGCVADACRGACRDSGGARIAQGTNGSVARVTRAEVGKGQGPW